MRAYPRERELMRAYPREHDLIRADRREQELIRAYQTKNAAFVSKIEKARAAGQLIRASSRMKVPVA